MKKSPSILVSEGDSYIISPNPEMQLPPQYRLHRTRTLCEGFHHVITAHVVFSTPAVGFVLAHLLDHPHLLLHQCFETAVRVCPRQTPRFNLLSASDSAHSPKIYGTSLATGI